MDQNISHRAQELRAKGYTFNNKQYLNKSLNIVSENWFLLCSLTLLYFVLTSLTIRLGFASRLLNIIIQGPLSIGYYIVLYKILKKQPVNIENFFDGFKYFLLQSIILSILTNIITGVGLILLILPGLFFLIAYIFAVPLLIFGKLNVWQALESSRIIITTNFWGAVKFCLIIILMNILGLLAFGIGILFTIPLSYALIITAFDDIYGFEEETITEEQKD